MKPDEMLSAAIRYILARDEWGPELNEAMNALDRLSEQGELERLASVNRVLEMVKERTAQTLIMEQGGSR